jgi:hypothetical protein
MKITMNKELFKQERLPYTTPKSVVMRLESEQFFCKTSITPKTPETEEEDWDEQELDGPGY